MARSGLVALIVLAWAIGCGRASLSDPVVAPTGRADAVDGYEAAIAAVQGSGYTILEKDKTNSYIRVSSQMDKGKDATALRAIEISTLSGSVRLNAAVPRGRAMSEADVNAMHSEMQQLAWAISGRARALAGQAMGPVTSQPYFTGVGNSTLGGAQPNAGGLQ